MKFIHIADVHLNTPIKLLGVNGKKRRDEIILSFSKLIDYIKEKQIDFLFIAGDFYEHEYIDIKTINIINELFKKIPDCKIFISPGNHDPYIKGSIYDYFKFNSNVHVFKEPDVIVTEKANIYGFGFQDFWAKELNLNSFSLQNNGKPQILVLHGNLDGKKEGEYNNIRSSVLLKKGFDYVALGHIHNYDFNNKSNIQYPGSFVPLSFSSKLKENSCGAIVGEIDDSKHNLSITKKSFDVKKFIEKEINISKFKSITDLILNINEFRIKEDEYMRLILVGERNFDLDLREISKHLPKNIVNIEDATCLGKNLEDISKETSLIGIFVKKGLNEIQQLKEKIEKEKDLNNKRELEKMSKRYERAIYLVLSEMD